MRKQVVLHVFTMAFLGVALTVAGQSPDPLLGTWKINLSKSTFSQGPAPTLPQVSTWVFLGDGQFRQSQDNVDAKGQKSDHREITLRFDGKEYPFVGSLQPTTRTYKRIEARTYEYVQRVNGKVTTTNRMVVAPDGKTRTLTITGTNVQGRAVHDVWFYEKQP